MNNRGVQRAHSAYDKRRKNPCALETLESRRLLSAAPSLDTIPAVSSQSSTPGLEAGYTPAQVLHAYGFDTLAANAGAVGGDGTGQTIAIVEAYSAPTLVADLHQFDQQFQLNDPPLLQQVGQTGSAALPASDASWSLEAALDVEWAHAVAPNANILIVDASSDNLPDLLTAVDTARHFSNVSVVSMSWGVNEFSSETNFDDLFTTPAGHTSITFVASAGDTASSSGTQWPAASPNVVSVGGTTLQLDSVTGNTSETSFSGSVSGTSRFEAPPAYQSPNPTSDGRTTPDVVYDANPATGFSVYDSAQGGWQTLGGTSAGAPQWSALVAIADQVRAASGQSSLNGATQTLPGLYMLTSASGQSATVPLTADAAAATSAVPSTTAAPAAGVSSNRSPYSSAVSGKIALTSVGGVPQAAAVVSGLATTTFTKTSVADTTALKNVPPARKPPVPNKHVKAAFLPLPAIRVPAFTARANPSSSSPGTSVLQWIGGSGGANAPVIALSSGALASSGIDSSAMLARALADGSFSWATSIDKIPAALQAIAAAFPVFSQTLIVPVNDSSTNSVFTPYPRSFYLGPAEIISTTGALASLINEFATTSRISGNGGKASHGHLRAWTITVGVVAFDALVIGYLVSRRRQKIASTCYVRWWES